MSLISVSYRSCHMRHAEHTIADSQIQYVYNDEEILQRIHFIS